MPSSAQIIGQLAEVTNQWIALSIAWHLVIAGILVALVVGWRPGRRAAGLLLTTLCASVAAIAWLAGNPFNGAMFTALTVALGMIALRLEPLRVRSPAPLWSLIAGALLLGFGLVYPHFLARPAVLYLVAAPVGVVPCPSLAVVAGFTLLAGGLESRAWSWLVVAAAAFYAAFGVWRLGVLLDAGLLAGAIALAVFSLTPPARRS